MKVADCLTLERNVQMKVAECLTLDVLYHTVPHDYTVMNNTIEYTLKYFPLFDHILLESSACSSCTLDI